VAADDGDLERSLRECLAVDTAAERLACFEGLARSLPDARSLSAEPTVAVDSSGVAEEPLPANDEAAASLPVEPADVTPSAQTEAPSPGSQAEQADFGREHKATVKRSGERMTATLVAVERAGYGQLRVTLDNGQVWEQVGTDRYTLASGERVVIERGTFNSFFLRRESSSRKVRFTRLQ
jgi:hypothetical protein